MAKKQRKTSEQDLLEAATRLFADKGYSGVSVRDIAAEAGVGMATLYHFYKDKKSIYRAVLMAQHNQVERALEEVFKQPLSAEWRLRKFMQELFRIDIENRNYLRLVNYEMLNLDDVISEEMGEKNLQTLYQLLRDTLNELKPGRGNGPLPMLLMSSITGFANLVNYRRYLKDYAPQTPTIEEEVAAVIEELMALCMAGAPAENEAVKLKQMEKEFFDLHELASDYLAKAHKIFNAINQPDKS